MLYIISIATAYGTPEKKSPLAQPAVAERREVEKMGQFQGEEVEDRGEKQTASAQGEYTPPEGGP